MKYLDLADGRIHASQIILGCMRIADKSVDEVEVLVKTALDEGINFFDHADIYGGGKSETIFGEVLKRNPGLREKMILQTKCGIHNDDGVQTYNFDKEYIIKSVEQSLERLQTSYVDVLLLHRPDTLMEPLEVADAFLELFEQGKVKYFGVSNMNPMQIRLLQKYVAQKLYFNQMQINPVNAGMIDNGINANMKNDVSVDHDGSILEYSRLYDMTIQAWSMLQASWEEECFLGKEKYASLNACLDKYAKKYNISNAAVVVAWLMRHPANMQPIAGTTSPVHLSELCKACDVLLTRREWYDIYLSVGKMLP